MPYGAVLAAVNQDLVLFPRLDGTEPLESIGRHSAELEDMEGELAGRCNSLTQKQGMRVCVGLDMIWLDFMSRRPLPLEDGETTISKLCFIAERLSSSLLNHSVEAFRQISVTGRKTLYLAVDLKCEGDLPEGAFCAAFMPMAVRTVSRQHGRPGSTAAVIANYPFTLACFGRFLRVFLSALEAVSEDIFFPTQGGGEGDLCPKTRFTHFL